MTRTLIHRGPRGLAVPILVGLLSLILGGRASAQERNTGRHRARVVTPQVKEAEASPAARDDFRWALSFRLGNQRGGDLYEAEVDNGLSIPWVGADPGGFKSSHFKTTLDNNLSYGLTIGRVLSPVWRLTADLAYSKMDVVANALLGQGGGRFRYDRFGILSTGLGLQRDLVAQISAPYALLAVTLVHVAPDINDGLSQTSLGGRVGLGYRQRVDHGSYLFLEGRLERTSLKNKDFLPEPQAGYDPVVSVEFRDNLTLFGLVGGLEFRW